MTESLMPLDVGAGYCRELEGPQGLRELVRTPVSSITVGSYTLESRPGNTGDVYSPSPRGTLNALNMPNRGFAWLLGELPEMIRITRAADKELTVSVAGFTPEENAFMVTEVLKRGVRVEVNWGCPNAGHDVISLDLGLVEKHLRAMSDKLLESHVGEKTSIMFKLSPHPSKSFRKALLHLIVKSHLGDGIVVCNTFPDGVGFSENGSPRINAVNPGGAKVMTGGVSGVLPIALGQVYSYRQLLSELNEPYFEIVGVGGITCGHDVRQFRLAGADRVQIVTALHDRGPRVFQEILQELV